jgi:hypothetical protein
MVLDFDTKGTEESVFVPFVSNTAAFLARYSALSG